MERNKFILSEKLLVEVSGNALYLETKYKRMWFQSENPKGEIRTELVVVTSTHYIMSATVKTDSGSEFTAIGSAPIKGNSRWAGREPEKASTAAIGRALELASYGTLDLYLALGLAGKKLASDMDDDYKDENDNHLAESPEPLTPRKKANWSDDQKAEFATALENANMKFNDFMFMYYPDVLASEGWTAHVKFDDAIKHLKGDK